MDLAKLASTLIEVETLRGKADGVRVDYLNRKDALDSIKAECRKHGLRPPTLDSDTRIEAYRAGLGKMAPKKIDREIKRMIERHSDGKVQIGSVASLIKRMTALGATASQLAPLNAIIVADKIKPDTFATATAKGLKPTPPLKPNGSEVSVNQ